ncbi:S16 family serine protease [Paenibacillus kribbensis]|uniref:S16 family serine protease n=1 Tax=Paenibacillus kribbensis TaxID=172713 RepID=UPI002118430B|nr:S16 family serine protease [Paenibacillus kribbensis]
MRKDGKVVNGMPSRNPYLFKRIFSIHKEHLLIFALLLIPAIAAFVATRPMPAQYILQGEMHPVKDLGVQGSVFFASVQSGIANNLLERWNVYSSENVSGGEIKFEPLAPDEVDSYWKDLTETDTLKYSAMQAVHAATELSVIDSETGEATATFSNISELEDARYAELLTHLQELAGNSLGLMTGIGLYEEANNIDFSDGGRHKIAGTGTMEEYGDVGSVGGLEQKLLGAEAAKVDLFFVPADYEWLGEEGNEAEAARVQKEHGLKLRIIPVETLEDAIVYLKQLD